MIIRQNETLMLDKCYLCGQENEMFLFCTNCGTKISCNINPYYLEEMRYFLKSALDIEKNYYHLQKIGENIESEIKTTESLAHSRFTLNTGNLTEVEIHDANYRMNVAQEFSRASIPVLYELYNEYETQKGYVKEQMKGYYALSDLIPSQYQRIIPVQMFHYYRTNEVCITIEQCIAKFQNESERIIMDMDDVEYEPEKTPDCLVNVKDEIDQKIENLKIAHKTAIAFGTHNIQIYVEAVRNAIQEVINGNINSINDFKESKKIVY